MTDWSTREFELDSRPSAPTLLRILRSKSEVEREVDGFSPTGKKRLSVRYRVVDTIMRHWVQKMWCNGVFITDSIIQQKARKVHRAGDNPRTSGMRFSNCWVDRFKAHNEFRGFRAHGEE